MKKSVAVFIFAALFSFAGVAQTVQEGINHWYAQRYQSARSIFEKLTAANPNNLEAVYWLGQTLLSTKDVAGAKALFQKTLAANGNAPWILVGMGEINLMEGRPAEARQQFEAALAASKGKKGADPLILNAVGRANVQPYSDERRIGDLDYAVAKLAEAAQQAPTNPDVFYNLGNAYRKKHSGGDAVVAYRKSGTFAPSLYRTATIFKSQRNWEAMLEYLNSAVAADGKFAPAYEELYVYNLIEKRDFAAAENFGKLYVSNSDPSVENDYILAQTSYVRKDYQNAIATANKILQQTNNKPKSRVYRLLAYSFLESKDTAKACEYSNLFLGRAEEDELLANDYMLHAKVCGRYNRDLVHEDIIRALRIDTVPSRQIGMLNDAIRTARADKNYDLEGELMLMSHRLRSANANPADLFYIGTLFYYSEDFVKSDSVLSAYVTAFPDTLQGYYWRALSRSRIDSSMTQGLAIPDFEKTVQLAEADKARFKNQGAQAAQMLAIYYNNIKNDRQGALAMASKGLEFDPENAPLKNLKDKLSGSSRPPAPKQDAKPKNSTASARPKGKA